MKKIYLLLSFAAAMLFAQATFAQKDPFTPAPGPDDPPAGDPVGGGGYRYGQFIPGSSNVVTNGHVDFWEGNNGTQDLVWTVPIGGSSTYQVDLTYGNFFLNGSQVHPNDEARSVSISGSIAGRYVTVYDSPSASTSDDWCEIYVKQDIPTSATYIVFSFETSYEDAYVRVTYHSNNGLDGKVSNIFTF